MDSNPRDGKLSLEELLKGMDQWGEGEDKQDAEAWNSLETAKFKVADKSGDGFLDLEELPALFCPETHEGVLEITAEWTLDQKDTDKDRLLSPKEFWEGEYEDKQ